MYILQKAYCSSRSEIKELKKDSMERVKHESVSKTLWEVGDENQKILTWAYLAFGLILWVVLGRFFNFLINVLFSFAWVDSDLFLAIDRLPISLGFILGGCLALGGGIYSRYNPTVNQFGLEVVAELKKVTWPPMNVTWKSTLAVIVTVFICAIILALFDYMWGSLISFVLQ